LEKRLEFDRDVEVIFNRVLAAARHDHDVVDAGLNRFLDTVLDDRLVDDHQHFLRLCLGGREKSCTETSCGKDRLADDALHVRNRIAGTIDVMLDPALFRENLESVRAGLAKRGVDLTAELEDLATLEARRRRLLPEIEGLRREQSAAGDEVARA